MPDRPAAPAAALFWLVCGFVALSALPLIYLRESAFFALSEPHYGCPVVMTVPGTAFIRSDVIGKGFFGASRNNNRVHKGIDLISEVGSPVFAAKSGRVAFAGWDKGYGNYIELRHPDGLLTRYAHLSVIQVGIGDWVQKGSRIGASGKTGNANDPRCVAHLHFEIRYQSHALNPADSLLDPSLALKPA